MGGKMKKTIIGLLAMAAVVPAAAVPPPVLGQVSWPIEASRLSDTVKVIASDYFEGRAPGSQGEKKTVAWLIKQYQSLGLEPAGDKGGWTQAVPLVHTRLGKADRLEITTQQGKRPLQSDKDIYLASLRPVNRIALNKVPLVFVGYGVSAPERGWDDFKGVDLKGKIAVFLINDPDFSAVSGDDAFEKFGGRSMTYYGRWTYKFEEAARRGAVGALIIHDSQGAGYGWDTVIAPAGEGYDIIRGDKDKPVALQGWLSQAAAQDIFAKSGFDLDSLKKQARQKSFQPVSLKGSVFSASLPVSYQNITSYNVLGQIKGAKRPDETIMFGAHWDAYGIGSPDSQGRTIRSGAIDDGVGVAAVLELARVFKAEHQPDRTLVFASWTAEERGILGSSYYAEHPLFPLDKTVANFTVDVLQTAGRSKDVLLIGAGQNSLENDLAAAAKEENRVVKAELLPERGLFFRADHLPFARKGVPVLLMMGMAGAYDLREGGMAAGEKWLSGYMKCYHQTCDRWTENDDFEGAAEDVKLIYLMGHHLAFSDQKPEWLPNSEFKTKTITKE